MHKKLFMAGLLSVAFAGQMAAQSAFIYPKNQATAPAIARDEAIEAKVEQVLSTLSLDEKIGQMVELDLRIITVQDKSGRWVVDQHKLDSIHRNFLPQHARTAGRDSGRVGEGHCADTGFCH